MELEGYEIATYLVIVQAGWYYKLFFGMLTDCVPICGYRRKPWILIGWSIAMICLAVMAFMSFEDPYCSNPAVCLTRKWRLTPAQAKFFNFHAPDSGTKFIVLSAIASFGYIIAGCASDAVVVEYSHREPLVIRGQLQTAIYIARYIGQTVAQLLVGVLLNGPNFKGSFSFNVAPSVMNGLFLAPCIVVVFVTVVVFKEEKQSTGFQSVNGFDTTAATPIQSLWAKVEPVMNSFSGVVANILFMGILVLVGKMGLNWNWRWTIALSTIAILLIDSFVVFMTIFDGLRNQWFFVGALLADQILSGVRFIVGTYCAVELAEPGTEGAIYGFITALNSFSSPVATVVYKLIDSYFEISNTDILLDDQHTRWQVAYTYFIAYGFKLASLVWLVLLPPQKQELQNLKRTGGRNPWWGATLLVIYLAVLAFSTMFNLFAIFDSTKCLRIAGGLGCH
ncbi:unnamed protein product [Aphanomyces euteiches]